MAQKLPAGCAGWLLAGLFGLFLIGKCTGSGDPPGPASSPSAAVSGSGEQAVIRTPVHYRYVQVEALNCRAEPGTASGVVRSLSANDYVGVLEEGEGWSLIDGRAQCWASSRLLGPERRLVQPVRRFAGGGGNGSPYLSDTGRSRSAYYANCSAARAAGAAPVYSGDPGYAARLDRDGDGVGCE